MNQILQLNGELPEYFPEHARRLHIFVCRKKSCSRRNGSVRAIRSSKADQKSNHSPGARRSESQQYLSPTKTIGGELFGPGHSTPGSTKTNPFTTEQGPPGSNVLSMHISAMTSERQNTMTEHNRASKSAEHAGSVQNPAAAPTHTARSPGATATSLAQAPLDPGTANFPVYFLDAEYETFDDTIQVHIASANIQQWAGAEADADASNKDQRDAYESTIDRTFQRFADRLSQNPMQVLRYEFKGQPLLYSDHDDVSRAFSQARTGSAASRVSAMGIPPCRNCGANRVFELQMTPQAIAELERDNASVDGMEWGTIILGVCRADCQLPGKDGEVCHLEEWVGVQWEDRRR